MTAAADVMTTEDQSAVGPVTLLAMLGGSTTTHEYRSREAIFAQGDKADAMFYVQNGYVKLTVASSTGKKAVIAILRHGDFFGEGCLGKRALRTCTAAALPSCTITKVNRAVLVRNMDREPGLARVFISYLLHRLGRLEDEFVDQIFSSSEKRLARILLLLAGIGPHSKPEAQLFVISQETLAEMVGTTRSRVSHFMNEFRTRGFIDYNGSVKVHRSLRTFLLRG
jgi:CRP/FNR family transcriptional regulator, cyclic AMP receptor protein